MPRIYRALIEFPDDACKPDAIPINLDDVLDFGKVKIISITLDRIDEVQESEGGEHA